jgi:cyclic-di-AMP phosphodiesterase PgpH
VGRIREFKSKQVAAFSAWRLSIDLGRIIIGALFVFLFSVIMLVPSPGVSLSSVFTISHFLGIPVIVILTMALLVLFGLRFHTKLYDSTARLSLIGIVAAGSLVGMRIDDWLPHTDGMLGIGWGEIGAVTTAAAIVTLMIDAKTALLCSASLIVFGSFMAAGADPGHIQFTYTNAATMASALIAIYAFHRLQSRTAIVKGAIMMVCGNAFICILLQFAAGQRIAHFPLEMLYTTMASSAAIVCFFSGVAVLEKPLGITTHLGLLELSDLNRPLLRKFCLEAPGSYAHSMMVANLAAAAAEAVGANAILARVGSYYHDIGKIRRAEFFIENQCGQNVHEGMTPSLSAVVLTAHVREGIDIAKKEHLPPVIKDIIEQHHGTTLIKYFYQRAASLSDCDCSALEQRFRYPGPKPQTREAAIVMLADSVEAASHTLARPTAARIEELVRNVTDNLIRDGQLDESSLLIRDVTTIKESFVHLLSGIMHRRIEYPAMPQPRTVENGSNLRYAGGGLIDSGLFERISAPMPTNDEITASTGSFAEEPTAPIIASPPLPITARRRIDA